MLTIQVRNALSSLSSDQPGHFSRGNFRPKLIARRVQLLPRLESGPIAPRRTRTRLCFNKSNEPDSAFLTGSDPRDTQVVEERTARKDKSKRTRRQRVNAGETRRREEGGKERKRETEETREATGLASGEAKLILCKACVRSGIYGGRFATDYHTRPAGIHTRAAFCADSLASRATG